MSIPLFIATMMPDDLRYGDFTDTSLEWMKGYRMLAEVCKRIGDKELWRDFDYSSRIIQDEFEKLETMVWERYETHVLQRGMTMTREQIRIELEQCAASAKIEIDEANGRTPRALPRPPAHYALDESALNVPPGDQGGTPPAAEGDPSAIGTTEGTPAAGADGADAQSARLHN